MLIQTPILVCWRFAVDDKRSFLCSFYSTESKSVTQCNFTSVRTFCFYDPSRWITYLVLAEEQAVMFLDDRCQDACSLKNVAVWYEVLHFWCLGLKTAARISLRCYSQPVLTPWEEGSFSKESHMMFTFSAFYTGQTRVAVIQLHYGCRASSWCQVLFGPGPKKTLPHAAEVWTEDRQVNLDWSPLTPAAILLSLIRPNCKSVGCRREVELLEETDAATAEHTASCTGMLRAMDQRHECGYLKRGNVSFNHPNGVSGLDGATMDLNYTFKKGSDPEKTRPRIAADSTDTLLISKQFCFGP